MMDCRCCCAISLMLLLQITAPDIVPQVSGTGDPHLLLPLQIATSQHMYRTQVTLPTFYELLLISTPNVAEQVMPITH